MLLMKQTNCMFKLTIHNSASFDFSLSSIHMTVKCPPDMVFKLIVYNLDILWFSTVYDQLCQWYNLITAKRQFVFFLLIKTYSSDTHHSVLRLRHINWMIKNGWTVAGPVSQNNKRSQLKRWLPSEQTPPVSQNNTRSQLERWLPSEQTPPVSHNNKRSQLERWLPSKQTPPVSQNNKRSQLERWLPSEQTPPVSQNNKRS